MSAISYAYDGNGKRVQKTVGTTVTTYVYDAQGNLAAEYGGPGSSTSGTTYLTADHLGSTRLLTNASGGPVERYDYAPFGEELTAGIDGRTTAMLFSTNQYPTVTTDGGTIKFTGKERDQETGLDFFDARYFSDAQGRFTSPDEFKGDITDAFTGLDIETNHALPYADVTDPQTLNKYAYVRNNPLRYIDPNGHCAEDLCVVEGGAAATGLLYAGAVVAGAVGLTGLATTLHNGGDTIISGAKSLVNSITSVFTPSEAPNTNVSPPPSTSSAPASTATPGTPTTAPAGVQGPVQSSKVEEITDAIDKGGFSVTANPKTPNQEGNITITHPSEPGTKLNVRVETHPIQGSGGQDARHANVELVKPGPKNRPRVVSNKHIDQ